MIQSKPIYNNKKEELIKVLYEKGIQNKDILESIFLLPRELFVAPMFANMAYEDKALPIVANQTISQPYTVAFMTLNLDIKPNDKVLEIGTGSGYQASVLKYLGAEVYTVERIEELYLYAKSMFTKLNLNVNQFLDDGSIGLQKFAPFDKIIVTAASPEIPYDLITQLKPNGKLIVPVGDKKLQSMILIKKDINNEIKIEELGKFNFVPLIGKKGFEN